MVLISKKYSTQKFVIGVLSLLVTFLFIGIASYIIQIIKNKDGVFEALSKSIGALLVLSTVCITYLVISNYLYGKQCDQLQSTVDNIDGIAQKTNSDLINLRTENANEHQVIKDDLCALNSIAIEIEKANEELKSDIEKFQQEVKCGQEDIKGDVKCINSTVLDIENKLNTIHSDLIEKISTVQESVNQNTTKRLSELQNMLQELKDQNMMYIEQIKREINDKHNNSINRLTNELQSLKETNLNSAQQIKNNISEILLYMKKFEVLLPQGKEKGPSSELNPHSIENHFKVGLAQGD